MPDSHDILLLSGGARTQFAMLPINLVPPGGSADYLVSGFWGGRVRRGGAARPRADRGRRPRRGRVYRRIPGPSEIAIDPRAAYVHLCSNNTIYGTQWQAYPDTGDVPLVADMTSDLLSRAVDVSRFGIIYAAAQKNLGPAGSWSSSFEGI